VQRVLVEKNGRGHAENFAPVQIEGSRSSRATSTGACDESVHRPSASLGTNEVVEALITAATADALVGVAA
jgi:hypothetical protein